MTSLMEIRKLALDLATEGGEPLSELDRALINLGVRSSVTSLDRPAIAESVGAAFAAGATPAQIQEILSLVSGLGVHSLMVACASVVQQARANGYQIAETLTPQQDELWLKYVGDDPFWRAFERELPGFLRSMLLLSPDQFEAFFLYCAVPWKSGQVRARIKELTAMACDATPSHRFMPGFRLHLANAIALGAGHIAIAEVLDLASAAPDHQGTA
ncbi:carboxymuconolactone decarboxylase family protein [Sphingomonas sp. ID0503]|uniref:carboxymuconolactone decarboxylase family protein n=1 Tax=Sphingomonas sp. ID0503 TaxID=3399691 RepID=UPI003AFA73A6